MGHPAPCILPFQKGWASPPPSDLGAFVILEALIRRGRGILKRAGGDKPLAKDWAEHKTQERALEERRAR